MTTFGQITIEEQTFTNKGKLVRPFATVAKVQCRSISLPMQRVITDFGADESFKKAAEKIKEHYAVDVPISAIRLTTEKHAELMRKDIDLNLQKKSLKAREKIIAETDGTMVPIVSIDDDFEGDKRKIRKTEWCEGRLALAREKGSRSPIYGAIIGSVDEAGKQLKIVVTVAGHNKKNRIHGVGDGAPWIVEQFDKQFGDEATYLIDFYHLSGYLHEASLCYDQDNQKKWFYEQQELMKANKVETVLQNLKNHIDDATQKEHTCPAAKCHQYIEKRIKQVNYKDALEEGLPIGSGEVESGHKFIIQQRIKLPGAWWLKPNANNMLALRTTRANGLWNSYWPSSSAREFYH